MDAHAVNAAADGASVLESWASRSLPEDTAGALPPHSATCLGCGPANPHGFGLRAHRTGDGVTCPHVFDERHVGAPGIAHGGAVAAVIDDVYGMLLYVVGTLAVTRTLEVDYLHPVLLGREHTFTAHMRHRDGRRLHFHAEATDDQGRTVARSRAVFVAVDPTHFSSAVATPHHPAPCAGTPEPTAPGPAPSSPTGTGPGGAGPGGVEAGS